MKWNYAVCHYYYVWWDFFLNYRERERERERERLILEELMMVYIYFGNSTIAKQCVSLYKKKNFCKYHKYTSYLIKVETPSLIKSLISCTFLWKKSSRSEPQMINDLNAMIRIKWVNRRRNQSRDRTR